MIEKLRIRCDGTARYSEGSFCAARISRSVSVVVARGCASLGIELSAKELIKEFDRIDENDGGLILFKEFARFAKTKTLSSGVPAELAAVASATELEAMGWSRLSAYCANLGLDDRGKTADLANRLFNALFPKDP